MKGGILGLLGMPPSKEEQFEQLEKQLARIKWAYDGEDDDAVCVRGIVATIENYIEFIKNDASAVTTCVNECVKPFVQGAYDTIDRLEQQAATRVVAQGRWFKDKDGPDYVPPSADNPQDN